jgi:transposase
MAAPYSQDLRSRVLALYEEGKETQEVARSLRVSVSWARRVKQRRRETGETAARPMGGKRYEKIDRVKLAELVRQRPDATLEELRAQLGVVCALSAICAALKQLRLSFKKRRCTPRSRTGRTWRSVGPAGCWSGSGSTAGG